MRTPAEQMLAPQGTAEVQVVEMTPEIVVVVLAGAGLFVAAYEEPVQHTRLWYCFGPRVCVRSSLVVQEFVQNMTMSYAYLTQERTRVGSRSTWVGEVAWNTVQEKV